MSTDTVKDAAPIRLVFVLARADHPRLYDDLIQFQKGVKRINRLRLLAYDGLLAQSGVFAGVGRGLPHLPSASSAQRPLRASDRRVSRPWASDRAGRRAAGWSVLRTWRRWAAANGWWCSSISMEAGVRFGSNKPGHAGWSSMSTSIGKAWRRPRRPPGRGVASSPPACSAKPGRRRCCAGSGTRRCDPALGDAG
ncbi:MAG: hypothetical protein FD131_4788 [Rhodocyclaceae bacterium]|nr:MAG: hypothetical protein FD131_4788 [Rhodocyclaceae bacterium]